MNNYPCGGFSCDGGAGFGGHASAIGPTRFISVLIWFNRVP